MKAFYYDEYKIQEAIQFLFLNLDESSNSKPFALHSLRVASILWENEAKENTVIAAILHDIVEDTDTDISDVENKFGKEVSTIVSSCTFDSGGKDYEVKLKNAIASFENTKELGYEALLVRAADLIDNSNYYSKANNSELEDYLVEKYETFMEISNNELKDSFIWSKLTRAYDENVTPLKK